jgi:hypothetical protein
MLMPSRSTATSCWCRTSGDGAVFVSDVDLTLEQVRAQAGRSPPGLRPRRSRADRYCRFNHTS